MSIANKLAKLLNIKSNIKTAINEKGGNVGDNFNDYANAISSLKTGGDDGNRLVLKDTPIKLGYSQFSEIPDYIDFNGVTSMENMFNNSHLVTVSQLNTSSVTNMNAMFYYCTKLTSISQLDTSSVTNMKRMFFSCTKLTTIPLLDTSKVENMSEMFYSCTKLTTIPLLDTSKVTTMEGMFYACTSLVSVPPLNAEKVTSKQMFGYADMTALTDFGGLIGLKVDFNGNYAFNKCPNLTYQSCINILNGLYDFRGNGDTSTTRTLKVHQNFLNAVGDEVSIGTNKGWVITT